MGVLTRRRARGARSILIASLINYGVSELAFGWRISWACAGAPAAGRASPVAHDSGMLPRAPAAQHHHWPASGCPCSCSKPQQSCEGSAEPLPGARTCAAPGAERARGRAAAPGLVILCAGLLLPDTPASYAERGHFDKARNVRPAPPCWPRL